MAVVTNKEIIQELELEDYIELKRRAYDFFARNFPGGHEMNTLNEYILNTLDYQMREKEAIIFKATALLPYDKDVCDVYQYGEEMYEKMRKLNYFYGFSLDIKKYEIELFHLDKLIEEGILIPPIYSDYSEEKVTDRKI